ncbi:MAG: tRNA (guanosine(37)-N1)-methyltransferase TrmD [Actinobacteria bacterium]|nr:tRNA (guanosine(37)-N1)-methyltransferase TrmD [Actinomycetota bacterium]MCL5883291.1 tRNA (guanosine(37)-N1)-methyltransferase TrmD [Actinomycetota bacterium]
MRVDIFTLFPEWFGWFFGQRHITNAVQAGSLDARLFNYRDYTPLKHNQVDDTPAGGGAGMVLRVDAVCAALEGAYGGDCSAVKDARPVYMLSPRGRRLDEKLLQELVELPELTLLCGRYEGFDERISEHMVTGEISIGDYVVSGGELPAMVLTDALARRLPGALGSEESAVFESFSEELDGRLEHPHYTKPADFRGWKVPEVLLSGNHAEIEKWRKDNLR